MHRDHRLYLDDMLEAIGNIREYVTGMDYEGFARDKKTRDAVVRNLEVIGEASQKIGQLKMLAPDGKIRLTDCTNTETLWRPVHSLLPERRST